VIHARSFDSTFHNSERPMCGRSGFDVSDVVSIMSFTYSRDDKCWECESILGIVDDKEQVSDGI